MKRVLLLCLLTVAAFLWGRAQSGYALLMEEGGSLSVCNNVVVNNGDSSSNVTAANNLFGHYNALFMDNQTDFRILTPVYIFNQGNNDCTTWYYDFQGAERIFNDTIDLGAFEYLIFTDYYPVYQENEGTLNFCNNIIINNHSEENVNVALSDYNYVTDNPDLFEHQYVRFKPKTNSLAVDAGLDSCLSFSLDMVGDTRLMGDAVDLGAYECRHTFGEYPAYQEFGGNLIFCNNLILNNYADTNVNMALPANNWVENSTDVFVHDHVFFATQDQSPTVDAGLNDCSPFDKDLSGDNRIVGLSVDIGAFEHRFTVENYPVYQEENGNLAFCNNIFTRNYADSNVNVAVSQYNLVTDTVDIFVNPFVFFQLIQQPWAVDVGLNSCDNSIVVDLVGDTRIQHEVVDLGAFEFRGEVESFPAYQEVGGALAFCNNIIVNNHVDSNVNVTLSDYNLVTDVPDVFVHNYSHFRLADSSVAVDAGNNACTTYDDDLNGNDRILHNTVDLGAYELRVFEQPYPVYQDADEELTFCNNILINNYVDSNVNVTVSEHNLVTNSDLVFIDKYSKFKLMSSSSAIDAGLNSCSPWTRDLVDTTRIIHEVIDLGAFELFVDDQRAVVFQDSGSTLMLCNNVIILNSDFAPNTNIHQLPPSNIVEDVVAVFRDNLLDFRPLQHSDAVDAGDNGCNGLPTDLDTVKRISNGRIDIGAFEIPELRDTNNYAGGDSIGGGGGDYWMPTYNAVVYESTASVLYLCDNIIVNSRYAANTNTVYGLDPEYRNWVKDTAGLFRDPGSDFRLNPTSVLINRGRNDCNNLAKDIVAHDRIIFDTIDIGAFEFYPQPDPVALEQVEGHQLTVCNNIIINNSMAFSVNDMNTPGNNLLVDNNFIFKNNDLDYSLREYCAAVNTGTNSCCPLIQDLSDVNRIIWDTIDLGAFELDRLSDSTAFTVWEEEGHQLQLCNNIIINNGGSFAVSDADASGNNLLVDHDDVFRHNSMDYRPRESSIVINAGINSCCSLSMDLDNGNRIFADTIDYGAFEQNVSLDDSLFAVLQVEGHTLMLCNNIVINNEIAYATNVQVVGDNNLLTNSDDVFVHPMYNYSPRPNSAAVNHGSNACCTLAVDMVQRERVYEEVIDIGAFEPQLNKDTAITLLGEEGAPLTLCNNIIILNKYSKNLNVSDVPVNNIVVDSDSLFIDNRFNFNVRAGSAAVNHGSNACVAWSIDMQEYDRIFEQIVDIGAFERYFEEQQLTAVLDSDTDGLTLCNNIIINNKYAQNVNVESVPENNIVTDNDTLFRNRLLDFTPRATSSAVNNGDNSCADWASDIATKSRVYAEIIDIGAYEVWMDTVPVFFAVNGEDSGGGGSADSASYLILYNNIVIYNSGHTMNVGSNILGDHNLLQDMPNVFVNALDTFLLKPQSPAVDAGDNQRVAWATDIKDDPRIACANIVDQGAYEHTFSMDSLQLTAAMVETENCQGYYFELTATGGAQHYIWSHSNVDTNVVQVSPLIPTEYTVIANSGGECADTATIYVVPSSLMTDSLGAPASVGTLFHLSYLRNHFRPPQLSINVSAEEACTGTVSNPRTGWSHAFSVAAHSVTSVVIPLEQAYPVDADAVGDFGLIVETTDSVSLYAANYNVSSFDVTYVLPVDALSDEYVLQTYTPMMNAEFVVVATEDSTLVEITPSRALQGGHAAQQAFTVMLQQGQTYLGMSQYGGTLGDLSGTVIHAHGNKPVAVFNGNVCALVPANNSYTDHLVEQAVGVNYWGRSFSITTTESQNFDVVRVTAMRNNTEVRRNGTLIATLQAYQTHEFQIAGTDGSCFLETSEPAGVYLYIAGAVQGNPQERSDPSMVWIPPTEQMLTDITFATFNSPGISDHYVNIVIPAAAVDEVTLDGIPIGGQFTLLNGNSAYAYARKHISNGTHQLHCDGGFIAHCYGLGFHESYGYAAGSKAVPLKEQLFVNGILNTELPADTKFCPYEPIDFSTYVNYPCDSVVWNFGDGSPTVNGFSATHGYEEPGTYSVAATLYITSNGAVFCSNLYARVRVVPAPTVTYYDTICQGVGYQQHGFDVPQVETGHYTYSRTEVAVSGYCDSIFVLELEVRDNYLLVEDTICMGNSYTAYEFNITPVETGVYIDTMIAGTNSFGCDSLVILQLSVTPNTDNPPAIEGEGWPCQGGTYTYSIDSLSALMDVVWIVPDSLIVLPGENPYSVTLLFGVYADSMDICVTATGGCGEINWCRTIWPQPYSHVQIYDTLCDNVTEYVGYGFVLTDVSDTNDIFIRHDTAVGGCDSTTVLSLVFMPTYQVADTIVICESEYPYLYHDTLLADTGFYQITLFSSFGCDSVVNLVMQSKPEHHTHFYDTVCDTKIWYDSTYMLSGDYDVLLENVHACDSLVTMHLTVYYSDTVAVDSAVCRDMLPMEWNGALFEDAGIQTAILENIHGCDSMVVMTLQVNELTSDTIDVYVLENDLPTYSLNGYSYDSSGVYTQLLTNAVGCDSTLIVNLTVLSNVSNTDNDTICESELPFTWNGVTFTEAGTQFAVLEASSGVDSLVVMNVTVTLTTYGTFDTAIVENALPLHYQDSTYLEAGTYLQYLTNISGCDSILTLNLTVYPNVTGEDDSVVCQSQLPIIWNGVVFDSAGTQNAVLTAYTGADSTVVMHLTVIPTTYGTIDTAIVENALPLHYQDSTYQEAGTYLQYLTNISGCDSILTLNLTVYPNVTDEDDSVICQSQLPIIWNGVSFDSAGTQSVVLTASTGADSTVEMHLTVIATTYGILDTAVVENALPLHYQDSTYLEAGTYLQYLTNVSGCDSILTLNLTVYPNVTGEDDSVVCQSQLPIIWNGVEFDTAGTQSAVLTAYTGADSTVVMHLTVIPTTYGTFDTAIVENALPLHYQDSTYLEAGTYLQHLTNVSGCDSILTLTLMVYPNVTEEDDSVVCQSQLPIIWNGVAFDSAGTQNAVLTAYTGADSTVVMHLTVILTTYGTFDTAIVENALPLHYQDSTYLEAGTYLQHLTNVSGCDSILTLTLMVYPNMTEEDDSVVCQSQLPIIWNGVEFDTAGTQSAVLTAYTGADSTVVMHLTVIPTTYGTFDTAIVENALPLHYQDSTYQEAGTYLQHLTNVSGCDSILTLTLTVYPNVTEEDDSVVCQSQLPIIWNGVAFDSAGTQNAVLTAYTGADSTVVMHLTVIPTTYGSFDTAIVENALPLHYQDSTYQEAGTYLQHLTNVSGCDSILTLNLTVYPNVTETVDSVVCVYDLPLTWNDTVFSSAGTKTTTIHASTGADSTIVMTVVANYPTDSTLQITVVENNLPFTLNGNTYDSAGVYTQHITNAAGCDSTLTIGLTVLYNVTAQVDSTICADALPMTWNGVAFTQADTLLAIFPASNGADSIVTMTLHVKQLSDSTMNVAVVQNNLPYTLNGVSYSAGGTYTQQFTNAVGCDSMLTLNLTVYYNVTTTVDTTVCAADLPFSWHGHSFTAAGNYMVTLQTFHGADSTVTYHLSVDNISATVGNVTHIVCFGESTGAAAATVTGGQSPLTYAWTNATGANISTSTSISNRPAGTYTFTVTDHIGCTASATVTLNTLNAQLQAGTIAADQVVCDGEDIAPFTGSVASGGDNGAYQWQISTNGTDWIPAPGTNNTQGYTYPDPAANAFSLRRAWMSQSCGTVYSNTVAVDVAPNSIDTIVAEVCQGEAYQENGFDVTADQTAETGEYTFEQHYATGHCDSAVILLLTVWPLYEAEIEDEVCEGEGYSGNGFEVSPLETIGTDVLQRTQNLQSVHGCDSVITLQLSIIDTAVRIVSLTPDFCDDMMAELTVATQMPDYVWSTGENAPTITVTEPGHYTVTATQGACSSSAFYVIESCQYELYLPNAITPSRGDGLNDYFCIPELNQRNMAMFEISIFNRWGEMVFYSTDKNFHWNGEYRGQIQYQTIYNYVIEYTDTSGRPFRRVGSITVL